MQYRGFAHFLNDDDKDDLWHREKILLLYFVVVRKSYDTEKTFAFTLI